MGFERFPGSTSHGIERCSADEAAATPEAGRIPMKLLSAYAVSFLVASSAVAGLPPHLARRTAKPAPPSTSAKLPAGATAGWWETVQRNLTEAEYVPSWVAPSGAQPSGWQAPNRANGFRTWFSPDGIRFVSRLGREGAWSSSIVPVRIARGALAQPLPAGDLGLSGRRVEIRREGLFESFENGKEGLRMSFRVAPPPKSAEPAPFELVWRIDGDLRPRIGDDSRSVELLPASGGRLLALSGFEARDGSGRSLPLRIEGRSLAGAPGLALLVDDCEASGPIEIRGVATGAAWAFDPGQTSALLGASVWSAGDVNNDGYSDVIVGAPYYNPTLSAQGAAFLFQGSASGLAASPSWTRLGTAADDNMGSAVATAGDVNGDGYADVVVGACACWSLYPPGAGRAEIFLGGSSGLSTSVWRTLSPTTSDEAMGAAVGTAGDVNNDGYSDVIVGSYNYSNGEIEEGRARVWHGGSSMSTTPVWSFEANAEYSYVGSAAGTAGDVNGDGYSDVIVGASYWSNGNTGEGGAWVFLGSGSGLASSSAWIAEGEQDEAYFGASAASAGDVNGDGYSDVVVGAYGWDGTEADEGEAVVYLGSSSGLPTSPAWTAVGGIAGASFGFSVATAGDVNGDGYSDVVVGAPWLANGETNEGRAAVYEGSASGLAASPAWSYEPNAAESQAGYSVGPAGDVNGDGYSDVVVGLDTYDAPGDPGYVDAGRAMVFHGGPGALTLAASWSLEMNDPLQTGQQMGGSVGGAGDVNNDGFGDVFVAAPMYDSGQGDEGKAWVFLGSATGLSTTAHWTDEGNQGDAWFGTSMAAGDVNGDGFGDIVVGVPGSNIYKPYEGRIAVYIGSATGLAWPVTAAWWFTARRENSLLGSSVATGDFNGDSVIDFVAGAPNLVLGQSQEGGFYVFYGSPLAFPTAEALAIESNQEYAHLGAALASFGDVNGDGYSDFVVGAPGWDLSTPGTNEGRAWIYYGSATGIDDLNPTILDGSQAGEAFGSSVSMAGDTNGDRYCEVLVGAPGFDAPGSLTDAGRAALFAGSASGLQTTPVWSRSGAAVGDQLGTAVGSAGDVNGDGYADFAVGSPFADHPETDEGIVEVFAGSAGGPGSSPTVTLEADSANASFGAKIGGSVDVNGDGYADLLVGAPLFDGVATDAGKVFLFYGNGSLGRSLLPRQTRFASPYQIVPNLAHSDSPTSFRLWSIGRSPFGRAKVQLETEALPFGTVFTGTGTGLSTVQDSGVAGYDFNELKSSLTHYTMYHWRERLRFSKVKTPLLPASRWYTVPRNGWNEADLRTLVQDDLTITGTQSPLNPLVGDEMTYVITIQNTGTAPAHFSRFKDWFYFERYVSPPNLVDTPGALSCTAMTQCIGTCSGSSWATGYIACEYGTIPAGETRVATLKWDIGQSGTIRNRAEISSPEVYDPVSSNNSWDVWTNASGSGIGDRAWFDQDNDGVQDTGEPGLEGVTMRLYDGSGVEIPPSQVTGSTGSYLFSSLSRYAYYYIGAEEPAGYRRTLQDVTHPDNTKDSDVSQGDGRSTRFRLGSSADLLNWDVGFVTGCQEEPSIEMAMEPVTKDSSLRAIMSFTEASTVAWYRKTGYNVRRATTLPPSWTRVGLNIADENSSKSGIQWTDPNTTPSPTTVFFYDAVVYNSYCGTPPAGEGP
jgi:hypothetical protein